MPMHHIPTSPEVQFLRIQGLAEHNDPKAQAQLANLYATGKGTPVNYFQAIKWHKLAGRNGNGYSSYLIGELYLTGRFNGHLIVEPNIDEALEWYNFGVKHGCKFGSEKIEQIYEMRHHPTIDQLRVEKIMVDKECQTDDQFTLIEDHFELKSESDESLP